MWFAGLPPDTPVLKDVVEQNPDNFAVWFNLGVAYQILNDLDDWQSAGLRTGESITVALRKGTVPHLFLRRSLASEYRLPI